MNNFKHDIKSKGGLPRSQALLLTAAGAALLVALPLNKAAAEEMNASEFLLPDMPPVSDTELDSNRGGFSVGNVNFSFGITVTTAISGPTISPISVTTNFNVDTPGHLTTSGPTITDQVNNTLAQAGLGGDSKGGAQTITPASSDAKGGTNVSVQLAAAVPPPVVPPITGTGDSHGAAQDASTPQTDSPSQDPASGGAQSLAQNSDPAPDQKPSFTAQFNPNTNSVNISNGVGTNVAVDTAHGIVTTITNTLSDMSFKTQVDLNYAIENYHDVVQNSQQFQQAMSIAQQMLALRGIAGH